MGKEISHFIIHFLIFYVLTMIEDIVEPDGYKGKFSRTCTDLSMLKEMKKKSNYRCWATAGLSSCSVLPVF